jgi:hypothetical protein
LLELFLLWLQLQTDVDFKISRSFGIGSEFDGGNDVNWQSQLN